jgi:hypothetical protein
MPNPSRSTLREAQDHARRAGLTTFDYPEPCIRGHHAPRFTANNVCTACAGEYRRAAKDRTERRMKVAKAACRPIQITHDTTTASAVAVSRRRFQQITGRPCSLSVIHKLGTALLADFLRNNPSASQVLGLLRW